MNLHFYYFKDSEVMNEFSLIVRCRQKGEK